MSEPADLSAQIESLQSRLTRLEESQAHDQHLVTQLNDIIHNLNREVAGLQATISGQQERINRLASRIPEEPRSLEDDKPPHY